MITSLLSRELICLELNATSKQDVFNELASLLAENGKVADKDAFVADLWAREEQGNTGFEEGIALPHAKSAAVTNPAVAIGISRKGIEYGAEDGLPSKLFFMIASPDGAANHHIEVLAELSSKLIEEGFVERLMSVTSTDDALSMFLEKTEQKSVTEQESKGFLIGVTGCPTGVAHTYLAAEALEKAAAAMGYTIKVETNGSIGVKNVPTQEEIARADAVIVACDKQVDINRFAGKRLIQTGVKAPMKDGQGVIKQALKAIPFEASETTAKAAKPQSTAGLYQYLMNGVSHMIPFVATGGLLIALALAIGGVPTEAGMQIPEAACGTTS